MNIWSLFSLFAFIISFLLANYVFYRNRRSGINRLFAVICLVLSFWAFSEFMYRQADDIRTAYFWMKAVFFWPMMVPMLVHFVIGFGGRRSRLNNMLIMITYCLGVFYSIHELVIVTPVRKYWGYTYSSLNGTLVEYSEMLFLMGAIVYTIILLVKYYLTEPVKKRKKHIGFLLLGFSVPLMSGLMEITICDLLNIRIPEFTVFSSSWLVVSIAYAMHKYELFSLYTATAAESIVATMPDFLILTDSDGTIVRVNHLVLDSLGYGEEELMGKPVDILHEEDFSERTVGRLSDKGTIRNIGTSLKSKTGRTVPVSESITYMKDKKGGIQGILFIAQDVTECRKAEEALHDERERLAVTLESIGDGVIATDTRGRITLMNKAAENMTGWKEEEIRGKDIRKSFRLANKQTGEYCVLKLSQIKEKGTPHGLSKDTVLISRFGEERYLSNSTAPIMNGSGTVMGYVLTFRDITQRKRMEEEILKGQKLEAVGLLAGGIAHDFNNLLTGVLGNLSLAKLKLKDEDTDLADIIADADRAAMHARSLTQQLLTFSKGGAPLIRTGDIVSLVKQSVTFMLRGSRVKSRFEIPEGIWPVKIDEGQIDQVVNNLVINAKQAMPEGGEITVYIENVSHSLKTEAVPLPTGNYVKLSISDQGVGIPKKYLSKIFDPYFTTKQDGNGLGLATAFAIIQKHSGYIKVDSEQGRGTVFHIYLPASEKKVEDTNKFLRKGIKGAGRIMLMDDDDIVRDVTGKILVECGYTVINARDGREALALYGESMDSGEKIDVIIMDLTIPAGMGGKEAIGELLKIDPGAVALVGSGYSNDQVMADSEKHGFKGCVAKPYILEELVGTIQRVMGKQERLS